MTLVVFIYFDDKGRSILVETLAQLFYPSNSVARKDKISDSAIDSRNLDANAPDQYGELLQFLGFSKDCSVVFDRKAVFAILIYLSPSRVSPL